jgi:transposase
MFWCPVHRSTRSRSGETPSRCRSSGRSLREVGQELGVNHETLRNWVNAANRTDAAGRGRARAEGELGVDERDELRRLRKKVAELELEKEILRKAAQYFAKEMGR